MLDGYLLINQLPALLKNKMTSLGLVTLRSTQSADEDPVAVRQKVVWKLFLVTKIDVSTKKNIKSTRRRKQAYLGLPLDLGRGCIGA